MNEVHAKRLLDSYKHWTDQDLLDVDPKRPLLKQMDEAELVILSHGTELDPILNYGNKRAKVLWEMDDQQFVSTPSRLTAEPMEREQRQALFREVTANGYVSNYTGIRISATGRRFYIEDAVVWNVIDEAGQYCGQAAAFRSIRRIEA